MTLPIDFIFVPQGPEYQAVCRGIKKFAPPHPQVIPIPLGINAVTDYLNQKNDLFFPHCKILLIGLGGSISEQHRIGDIVIYNTCRQVSENNQIPILQSSSTLIKYLDEKLKSKVSLVNGLTTNKVISNKLEKKKLAEIYQSEVVDMEGYPILLAFKNTPISVAIMRVISDDINHNIPDISLGINNNGKLNYFLLLVQFMKQPLAAFRLIKGSLISLKILEKTIFYLFN